MIRIPIPIEQHILLVHPLKGIPRHIITPVFGEKGADAAGLGSKFDRCPLSQSNRLRKADLRKVARPKFRIALLTEKVSAFPKRDIRTPSGQVEPGLEFIPTAPSGLRAGFRLVITRQVGEADP